MRITYYPTYCKKCNHYDFSENPYMENCSRCHEHLSKGRKRINLSRQYKIWSFIIYIILLFIIGFLVGSCTSIDYGSFHYRKLGGTKIGSLNAVKDGNDILVELTDYQSEQMADVARETAKGTAQGILGK